MTKFHVVTVVPKNIDIWSTTNVAYGVKEFFFRGAIYGIFYHNIGSEYCGQLSI